MNKDLENTCINGPLEELKEKINSSNINSRDEVGWSIDWMIFWYSSLKTLLFILSLLTLQIGEMNYWRLFCFCWEKEQKCWWELELIHSWEMNMWDQFPVLPFSFHFYRVKQQEIWQEKVVILVLKDYWRNMREILKD